MVKVTEIKFFKKDSELYIALFGNPPAFWCTEFWLENVKASNYGITTLPEGIELERKYNPESLGFFNLEGNNDTYEIQQIGNGFAGVALKGLGVLFGLHF